MNHSDFETEDLQLAAAELGDAVEDLDRDFLAAMTPEQRALQLYARAQVAEYFDRLWDAVKLRGLVRDDDAVDTPDIHAVMGLRDLTTALQSGADSAQEKAGDESIEPPTSTQIDDHEKRICADIKAWAETASPSDLRAARFTVNPAAVLDLAEIWQDRRRR